ELGAEHSGLSEYSLPLESTPTPPLDLSPPGSTAATGVRANACVTGFQTAMPKLNDATNSEPSVPDAIAPGNSPNPVSRRVSCSVRRSIAERVPLAAPKAPELST